jgi:bifunctional DNA-binding transcriptional regulator/antitoxin component of YhaV-PrlF toxin-antitoxin module
MEMQKVRMIEGGKLIVPVQMRRRLGIAAGDSVLMGITNGELHIRPLNKALAEARALVREHVPADAILSDELSADRRADAAGE